MFQEYEEGEDGVPILVNTMDAPEPPPSYATSGVWVKLDLTHLIVRPRKPPPPPVAEEDDIGNEFEEENFEGAGTEVRSMDQRDRKVGLFGDFLQRVGHGKFVE